MLIYLTRCISIFCFIDCQMSQLAKHLLSDILWLEIVTTTSFQTPQILIVFSYLIWKMWQQWTADDITSPRYLMDVFIIFSCFHSLLWAKSSESSQSSHLLSFEGFHAVLMVQLHSFTAQLTVLFSPSLVLTRTVCLFCCISSRKCPKPQTSKSRNAMST